MYPNIHVLNPSKAERGTIEHEEWAEFLQGMSGDPQMLSAEYLDLLRLTKPKDEDLTKKIDSEFTTEDPGNTLIHGK